MTAFTYSASWRRARGLSQAQLARALGVSRDTVISWDQPEGSKRHAKPGPRSRRDLAALDARLTAQAASSPAAGSAGSR